MLDKRFFTAVDEAKGRIFSVNNLYRFYMDREDIADNMIKKWDGEGGDPQEVTNNLVTLATDLY